MNSVQRRKKEILSLCFSRGWVSITDIVALNIPNLKYARRYMDKLNKDGYVIKITYPVFQKRGRGMNFYTLTKVGYKNLNGDTKGYKAIMEPNTTHLIHHYLANFFITGLTVLSKRYNELKTTVFSEREIRRYSFKLLPDCDAENRPVRDTHRIIPDFLLIISTGKSGTLYLGEVDTCTENIDSNSIITKTIEKKFKNGHAFNNNDYLKSLCELVGVNRLRVAYLHITTGNADRIEKIVAVATSIANTDYDIFATSADDILNIPASREEIFSPQYERIFMPVWHKVRGNLKNHSILED